MPLAERRSTTGRAAEAPTANGFTLLRVRKQGAPFAKVFYIKAHRSKKGSADELPGDRTIFVANAYCGEAALSSVFAKFGEIERIAVSKFHDSKRTAAEWLPSFQDDYMQEQKDQDHAHVVFAKKGGCKAALSCSDVVEVDEEEGAAANGILKGFVDQHRRRQAPAKDLEEQVNAYMAYFDERTKAEKEAAKNKMVDDDGFELVTYKRKAPMGGPPDSGIVERKSKKQLVNFYSFQIREKKREELAALRNKFEADKQRVETMKKKRLFKPF